MPGVSRSSYIPLHQPSTKKANTQDDRGYFYIPYILSEKPTPQNTHPDYLAIRCRSQRPPAVTTPPENLATLNTNSDATDTGSGLPDKKSSRGLFNYTPQCINAQDLLQPPPGGIASPLILRVQRDKIKPPSVGIAASDDRRSRPSQDTRSTTDTTMHPPLENDCFIPTLRTQADEKAFDNAMRQCISTAKQELQDKIFKILVTTGILTYNEISKKYTYNASKSEKDACAELEKHGYMECLICENGDDRKYSKYYWLPKFIQQSSKISEPKEIKAFCSSITDTLKNTPSVTQA